MGASSPQPSPVLIPLLETHMLTQMMVLWPGRGAELARQRSALEERLAVSEARFAALEQAFAGYREQVRR